LAVAANRLSDRLPDHCCGGRIVSRWIKLINWFIAGLLLVLVAYGIQTANATPDKKASVTDQVVNTSSNAYGFGGLGDVDIRDCLSSYQVFILWQGVRVNPLCVATQLDILGKHHEAAQMRCSVGRVRQVFGNRAQCIIALEVEPIMEPPDLSELYNRNAQIADEEDQAQDDYIQELNQRLDKIEGERKASARRASRQQAEDRQYAQQILDELEEYK